MKTSLLPAFALALASTGFAQVDVYLGASPNASSVVDFDDPPAPLGPIASNAPYLAAAGIASVDVIGTWAPGTDRLNSNTSGRSLTVTDGALTVSAPNDRLDNATPGDGFAITLTGAFDEIGLSFVDQVDFVFEVELLAGTVSLGSSLANYPIAASDIYFRASGPADGLRITFPAAVGGVGIDNIRFGDGPEPIGPPINCVETTFFGGNQGNLGGCVYFDLSLIDDILIGEIDAHFIDPLGTPVGIEVYTTPNTHIGIETDISAWTLGAMDDGTTSSAGRLVPTEFTLAAPLALTAGNWGIAIVAVGGAHGYTNGNGSNQIYASTDGVMTLTAGSASNAPFTPLIFEPRVFNGRLCRMGGQEIGTTYCTALDNETGQPGRIVATGSTAVADDDLKLFALGLPPGEPAVFVTSRSAGFFPAGTLTNGNVCLGTDIGRFNPLGPMVMTDAAGRASLAVDLATFPQRSRFVPVAPGETWYFQTWHRESVGLGANFTDAVEIAFD